jgi:hypothetical protein
LYDLPAEGRTQQKRAVGTTLSNTLAAHRHFVNRDRLKLWLASPVSPGKSIQYLRPPFVYRNG